MINNEGFVFYESAYKQVMQVAKRVGPEVALQLVSDIAQFGLYGEWPEEDSMSFLYGFEQIATSISSAKDRHAKSKENGAKGGRPKVELDKEAVLLAYSELHNWEKVAARFNVSAKTLREKRKEWEQVNTDKNVFSQGEELQVKKENTGSIGRNLNINVNSNKNTNTPLVPRSVGASPQTPKAPDGDNKIVKKTVGFNF